MNVYGNIFIFAYAKLDQLVLTQAETKKLLGIFAGLLAFMTLLIIPLWKYGKAIRKRWDRRPSSPALVMSFR
jgi:hypothetical protein